MNPSLPIPDEGMTLDELSNFVGMQMKRLNMVLKSIDGLNIVDIKFDLKGGAFIQLNRKGLRFFDGTKDTVLVDVNGVAVFTGVKVQTTDGVYPNIELSSDGNLLTAFQDALNYIAIDPDLTGSPTMVFITPNTETLIYPDDLSEQFTILVRIGDMAVNAQSGKMQLAAFGDIELLPGGQIKLTSWSKLYNTGSAQTLQQALDAKQGAITSGDVVVVSGVASLNNNIDTTHLADGSVSNTEFQFINSLTSNAQNQLNAKATVVNGGDKIQSGVGSITTLAASNNYSVTITFPTPFSAPPTCHPSVAGNGIPNIIHAPVLGTVTATTMQVFMFQADAIARTMPIHWIAVGP